MCRFLFIFHGASCTWKSADNFPPCVVSAEVALSTQHHSFLVDATEEPPVTLNLAVFPHLPCILISTSVTTSVWPVFSCYVVTWAVTWGYMGSLILPMPCKCRRVGLFPENMVYIWFSFHYFICQLEGLCLFPSVTASKQLTCLEKLNTRDLEKSLDARRMLNRVWPSVEKH